MRQLNIKIKSINAIGLAIFIIGGFHSLSTFSQTCSAGTTTVSSSSTSQFATTANNQCLEITSSGSITTSNPIVNTHTGFVVNNAGSIESGGNGINNDGGNIATLTNLATGVITNSQPGALNIFAGNIGTLNNYGSITSPTTSRLPDLTIGIGLYYSNQITTLNNYSGATISADRGIEFWGSGAGTKITTLNNYGTISGYNTGIYLHSALDSITTLNNQGTISGSGSGRGIDNGGTITTLNNSGAISSQDTAVMNSSNITNFTNNGTINGIGSGSAVGNTGTIGALTNNGTLSSGHSGSPVVLWNNGTINSFINNGTITSGYDGVELDSSTSTIQTLTNNGTITSGQSSGIYIFAGSIGTLNNAQGVGNSSGALTYTGALPTNYNIIINGPTNYGQLAGSSVTGTTNFGIYSGSSITARLYAGVLQGLTTSNVGATRAGQYNGMTWTLALEAGSSSVWDLSFAGPSTSSTQQSLVNSSASLQNIFTLQNSVLANSFTYDCAVFDKNNVCVSAGGRYTAVQSNGPNNTSALLIGAYRLSPNYRIGAYADQNLSVNNAGSGISLGNSTPLIGLFGVWNEKLDGTGTEVKVSAAYGQKNATVTRQVVGLSEAGSGSSNLNSQGAQILGKYGFAVADNVIVSPYAGVRYTQNNMGGYTESTTSSVTAPLTYSALNTKATTALAGVGVNYKVIPQAMLFASAGVESDMTTSNGTYSATGVTGLTPINFNPNPVKTRATATLGAYYDIEKNHRVGITGIYRQEPFSSVSTTSVLATYTVGL